jgi:hypothetical protein
MATALVIEEESGTCSGFMHPHNGYHAGDFHGADRAAVAAPVAAAVLAPVLVRVTDNGTVAASALQSVHGVLHVDDRAVARAA